LNQKIITIVFLKILKNSFFAHAPFSFKITQMVNCKTNIEKYSFCLTIDKNKLHTGIVLTYVRPAYQQFSIRNCFMLFEFTVKLANFK